MSANGKRLEGKVAMITGGASGLGKGTADRFLREGAKVMLVDISGENLAAAAQELGRGVATIQADVSVEKDIEAAVAATVEKFGRLDAAVNSAGIGTLGHIVDMDVDSFAYVIDVDLVGIFICLKHEAGQMIKQADGGSIVNVASLNSRMPGMGLSAYCTAKAGVEMLTKVAAMEMGPDKIRVNAISPGLVDTPMTNPVIGIDSIYHGYLDNTPLGRIGTTDDIAALALFLASDEATWITGENIIIDGGQHTMAYPDEQKLIIEHAEKMSES
jgi:3-oxoacyl-[acyl-carrier protein] reductase